MADTGVGARGSSRRRLTVCAIFALSFVSLFLLGYLLELPVKQVYWAVYARLHPMRDSGESEDTRRSMERRMELERQIDMVQLGGGEVERKSAASEALGGLRAGLGALGNKDWFAQKANKQKVAREEEISRDKALQEARQTSEKVQREAKDIWGGQALPGLGRKVIEKGSDARDTGLVVDGVETGTAAAAAVAAGEKEVVALLPQEQEPIADSASEEAAARQANERAAALQEAKEEEHVQEVAAEQRAKAAAAFDAEISAVDGATDELETLDKPESTGQSGKGAGMRPT